jgi:hypothetical protein
MRWLYDDRFVWVMAVLAVIYIVACLIHGRPS